MHGIEGVESAAYQERLVEADAHWTKQRDFFLGLKTADCIPVFIYDQCKGGAIHIGWRGLVAGIVNRFFEHSAMKPPNCQVVIGPCIRDFEVKKDVEGIFKKNFPFYIDSYIDYKEGINIDLVGILREELIKQGVKSNHILDTGLDTLKNTHFASYRRGDLKKRNISLLLKK